MKKIPILISIILIFIIVNAIIFILPIKNKYETRDINIFFEIGENFGVNLDKDAVYFGRLKKGSSTTLSRYVLIKNEADESKTYHLSVDGDLAELITLSENEFTLLPREEKKIKIKLNSDPLWDYGNYTGKLKIKSK